MKIITIIITIIFLFSVAFSVAFAEDIRQVTGFIEKVAPDIFDGYPVLVVSVDCEDGNVYTYFAEEEIDVQDEVLVTLFGDEVIDVK